MESLLLNFMLTLLLSGIAGYMVAKWLVNQLF